VVHEERLNIMLFDMWRGNRVREFISNARNHLMLPNNVDGEKKTNIADVILQNPCLMEMCQCKTFSLKHYPSRIILYYYEAKYC